jgi:hypothetical protein
MIRPLPVGTILLFLVGILPVSAQPAIDLTRPGEHESVRDLGNLIDDPDEQQIRTTAAALLRDRATPIGRRHHPFDGRIMVVRG